jgi:hypothetical protein
MRQTGLQRTDGSCGMRIVRGGRSCRAYLPCRRRHVKPRQNLTAWSGCAGRYPRPSCLSIALSVVDIVNWGRQGSSALASAHYAHFRNRGNLQRGRRLVCPYLTQILRRRSRRQEKHRVADDTSCFPGLKTASRRDSTAQPGRARLSHGALPAFSSSGRLV